MFSTFAPMFSRPMSIIRSLESSGGCHRNLFSTRTFLYARSRFHSGVHLPSNTVATRSAPVNSFLYKAAGVSALGLGISLIKTPAIHCDASVHSTPEITVAPGESPPPYESIVNPYELGFGTVCGICAGIFIKKGAKALAFALGGVFVLLQYLGSLSLVRVDWVKTGSRFENLFYRTDAKGEKHAPTVFSTWSWLVDFLTADFQKRASFIAGLALGLRLG